MRLYIDLDTRAIIVAPTVTQQVSNVYLTRRDNVPVEVQFCRLGVVQELASGATGQIGIKATYSGSLLASDSAWDKTGTGESAVYTFGLNLNTAALDALFPLDTEDSVDVKFEVSWTASGLTTSTLPCTATVYNDVLRGTEGDPLETTSASQFRLMSPDGTVWGVSVDNSGVPQASALSGVTVGPSAIPLRSADDTVWTLTVTNSGTLETTAS